VSRGARRRVAFVNSHPIQYFAPLYAAINRSADLEAVPIYLTDHSLRGGFDVGFKQPVTWDIDLLAGTDPIFVRHAKTSDPGQGLKLLAPDIWSIVRRGNFDALVVHGFVFGANHIAVAAAKSAGIPTLVRGETHLGLRSRAKQGRLRTALVKAMYRRFDGFLAIGSANRAFYRSLGIEEERIFHFPYTVDNNRMMQAARMDPAEREAIRARHGLTPGRPAVLFASKFDPRKHADDLVRACARLAEEGVAHDLVLAGAGQMEGELRALAAAHPMLKVVFTGFINQRELPGLMGACDLFVLPSENEPWGLIINEAMCAGLPIVASQEIGAVADLVHDGENGHVFDAGDVEGLAGALRPILTDAALRARMGERSLEIIGGWSYAEAEAGLRAAIDDLQARRAR
jgi:glycosyltransferase involved in cell wall biosynthesis